MDTFLAIASRREDRSYSDEPVPAEVQRRILEAGRIAGSATNKQPWRFLVVRDVEEFAKVVYVPDNIIAAQLVIAIVIEGSAFDCGRAAQNMMLAAWNEGIGSSPNGISDKERGAELLGLEEGESAVVLSFGYPARPRKPETRSPEEWIERANRKPFDEVVKLL
jgi:nitroreductase